MLLLLSGCAHGHHEPVEPTVAPVRVEVTNYYALPIEIDVLGGGALHHLGTVHPGMVARFVIPQALLANGAAEFQAHPTLSGPTFRSGQMLLAPGSFVDFTVTAQMFNSTATIRP
jgi:hypothetical protein